MRIAITVDDVIIELDDDSRNPTLDGIESVLKRMSETAFELYSKTFDKTTVTPFTIDFTPIDEDDIEVDDSTDV